MIPFTSMCNATGVPAMSVPLEWTDDGLPIGMHFVGRFGAEDNALCRWPPSSNRPVRGAIGGHEGVTNERLDKNGDRRLHRRRAQHPDLPPAFGFRSPANSATAEAQSLQHESRFRLGAFRRSSRSASGAVCGASLGAFIVRTPAGLPEGRAGLGAVRRSSSSRSSTGSSCCRSRASRSATACACRASTSCSIVYALWGFGMWLFSGISARQRSTSRFNWPLMIFDAQVHIWAANTPERPWPARAEPHRAPLGKERVAGRDGQGRRRPRDPRAAVLGGRPQRPRQRCRDAAHPNRFATMGRFDPDAPGARETIADWKKQPGMLGMRFTFHTPGAAPAAARRPLRLGLGRDGEGSASRRWCCSTTNTCTSPTRWPSAIPACGWCSTISALRAARTSREATNFATLDNVLALAKRPNVAAKVSAMPCYADDKTYPFRSVHPSHPAGVRRLRAEADLLGHRPVAPALHLPAGRDHVHRGDALAEG